MPIPTPIEFPLTLAPNCTYWFEKYGFTIGVEVHELEAYVDSWDHLFRHWNITRSGDIEGLKFALKLRGDYQ
jgi:hypothetical protein